MVNYQVLTATFIDPSMRSTRSLSNLLMNACDDVIMSIKVIAHYSYQGSKNVCVNVTFRDDDITNRSLLHRLRTMILT